MHSVMTLLRASLLASFSLFCAVPAQGAGGQALNGHIPDAVAALKPIGRLAGTNRLDLAIGLPLRNSDRLGRLLQQIYDPASPNFRHYLTPAQFTEQFGPTEADYQSVAAFAKAHGLTVSGTHPNRILLDVNGAVADIERALHVKMQIYQHPTEARTFYAPDSEPSLDLATPVLDVGGLDNYVIPHPCLRPMSLEQAKPYLTGSAPDGAYLGNDFRAAYVPGVSLTGTGQTVGLLEFDSGYLQSDITAYETLAGLPNVPVSAVLLDGYDGELGEANDEVSLDIEMAISMAPGLTGVIVYEGSTTDDILNRMANDNLAKQIGASWTYPIDANSEQIFRQFAAQGQSFFNASGDSDAYTGTISTPADDTNITVVGGTTLTTSGPGGVWVSETVWNWGNEKGTNYAGIGSGGGISTVYAIPSWQTNISMAANHGSTTMRNLPDVALTADNVYVMYGGGQAGAFGGTSCAAPLWAGFIALVNQQSISLGSLPVGFINPALDTIGSSVNYTNCFHDITTGNNYKPSSPTNFPAEPGYDLCTGWGTPAGMNLINALPGLGINIELPASATEGVGVLAEAGSLQLRYALSTNLVITLVSGDPAVQVPASVTVLAGQTNAVFNLTLINDGILDGTRTATITASAPGYGSFVGNMTVFDIETATLQVSFPAVTKGQGAVQGTVQVSAVVGGNVTVSLSSTDTNLIAVPATMVVPSGQSSATFVATVGNDGQITGPETVNVTAHVQNWTNGVAVVVVSDNLDLSVTLPEDALASSGVQTNAGFVTIAGTLTTNLTVSLVSSLPGTLTVPATATIVAGQLYNEFNLTLVSNSVPSTNQTVTVTASAPGFTSGSASVQVLPSSAEGIPANPAPSNLATNVPANTNLSWGFGSSNLIQNGGFETGTFTNWTLVSGPYNGGFVMNNGTYQPYSPDSPSAPFAGNYDAVGDANGPGTYYMYQTVAIPLGVGSATLSWAQRVRNFYSSFSASQEYQLRICNTNNTVLAVAFSTGPGQTLLGGWVQTNYDLTSFAGQNVRVMLWVNAMEYFMEVYVDSVSLAIGPASGSVTNNVYFGVDPALGTSEYQGSTTNTSWTLPLLAPATTYFWQVFALSSNTVINGPVWQFTTAGVDHFAWNAIPSAQYLNQPFSATITAQDAFNSTVSNFTGDVLLSATVGPPASSNFVAITPSNSANFVNGVWTGNITALQDATNVCLYANDGTGQVGESVYFNIDGLAPAIVTQPANQTLLEGATATFTVTATGFPPLSYQWTDYATNIANATNASLTLSNVQITNDGTYAVIISNVNGSTTSSNAVLTVGLPPAIVVQPASQSVESNCSATFNVSASGVAPLSYQWSQNSLALGAQTNSSLAMTNVQSSNFGNYSVIVTNALGAITSSVAVLALASPPVANPATVLRFAEGGVRVNAAALTTNDTVAIYDSLTVTEVSSNSTVGGNVILEAPWVYYAPPAGGATTDTFTYTVSDGHCGTATGTVTVQIKTNNPLPLNFAIGGMGNGSLQLTFDGIPGDTYGVDYTISLSPPNWQVLTNQVADSFGVIEITDSPPTNIPARFYRAVGP
jgi:hypothetical protein